MFLFGYREGNSPEAPQMSLLGGVVAFLASAGESQQQARNPTINSSRIIGIITFSENTNESP